MVKPANHERLCDAYVGFCGASMHKADSPDWLQSKGVDECLPYRWMEARKWNNSSAFQCWHWRTNGIELMLYLDVNILCVKNSRGSREGLKEACSTAYQQKVYAGLHAAAHLLRQRLYLTKATRHNMLLGTPYLLWC